MGLKSLNNPNSEFVVLEVVVVDHHQHQVDLAVLV